LYPEASRGISKPKLTVSLASNAGSFLWIDLRKYILGDGDVQALKRNGSASALFGKREAVLEEVLLRHGVSLSRGSIFFTEDLGWFRLTFTLPKEELAQGLNRLASALGEVRDSAWE